MNPINLTSSAFGAPGSVGAAGASYAAAGRRGLTGTTPPSQGSATSPDRIDRVELSEEARALATNPTPIREDLVNRIRAEIANGTYDIDGKLDQAVNELAKDLSGPIDPLSNVYA
ncbi:MAG: flagellar biosynthesis anti-sigma factor FlgM [Phycisphaerales bacterium]